MIEDSKKKIEGTEKEKAKKAELKKKRAATKKRTARKDSAHTTEQVSVERRDTERISSSEKEG